MSGLKCFRALSWLRFVNPRNDSQVWGDCYDWYHYMHLIYRNEEKETTVMTETITQITKLVPL